MAPQATNEDGPQRVADALLQARRAGTPADAMPLAGCLADADAAYRVQDLVAGALRWHPGGMPRVWKSGGPSREAPLTHAGLPEAGVRTAPARLNDQPFHQRGIEAEVALRLGRDVRPADAAAMAHEGAAAWVDALTVSIEIVDSRWQQATQAPPLLKLADLQSHGALVLGPWQRFVAADWARQSCQVQIGSAAARSFTGTHSLGDPLWLLPIWLRHVTRHGATVPRGTVVTTGTWCGLLPAQAGDLVRVAFDGLGEASVQL